MPSASTQYSGQTVDFGPNLKLTWKGSRVEAQLGPHRVVIAGGRIFVEHPDHKPYLDTSASRIRVVGPLKP